MMLTAYELEVAATAADRWKGGFSWIQGCSDEVTGDELTGYVRACPRLIFQA